MPAPDAPRRLLPENWMPPSKGSVLAALGPREQWPALLTLDQAGAYLQVSTTWLEESGVPVVLLPTTGRSGRALRRWRREDLDRYIKEHVCPDRRVRG